MAGSANKPRMGYITSIPGAAKIAAAVFVVVAA